MHYLLRRQIKRLLSEAETLPPTLAPLFEAISATYQQADIDRAMIERSLDIASQEMLEQNHALAHELKVRRAAESRLEHLTNYDELTGLVNRTLLSDRIKQAITSAHRHVQKVAILALGLDHFKMINDSLGHDIGNELLKIISGRLSSCVRGCDSVARLSGDEFALVMIEQGEEEVNYHKLPEADDMAAFDSYLIEILQRILKTVSETVVLAGRELQVTCSIGVSRYPQDGDHVEALLKNADAAMTSAKQLGRNIFQFYTPDLSARIGERLAMQGKLRLALEREEFVLHYQPQVDLRTGCIVGMEALIRWNHPEIGEVPPARFIGLAEETGLIVPIGAWVIRTACAQNKAWQLGGYGNFRIAVNLSVRQFTQSDLVQFIAAVLAETCLDPRFLEIELTESLVMTDVERTIDILRGLKALGVQLSIDDFGTGYSSLSYLRRFPIDALKIDQSFVHDIVETADDAAIVKAIISMAHSLGIQVIAEGVETEAQCDFLRVNMCDEIQGFFFSQGLPNNEIELLLREGRQLPDHLLHFSKRKRTLLLVDDEENILSALKRLLRHENCAILTASSAQAGLALLAQQEVDVIVTDQRMAGMTGVEFLRIAKENYPDTVRIVLTGYTELQSVIGAVNEGAVYQFLMKPWEDTQLRWNIEEAFKHKELVDENRRLHLEMQTNSHDLAKRNRQLKDALEQKQGEMAQDQRTIEIIREALQHVPLPTIGLDEDGMIAFINEAAQVVLSKHTAMPGVDAKKSVTDLLQTIDRVNAGEYCRVKLGEEQWLVTSNSMDKNANSRCLLLTLTRCTS